MNRVDFRGHCAVTTLPPTLAEKVGKLPSKIGNRMGTLSTQHN
jgi:hypothetical protein